VGIRWGLEECIHVNMCWRQLWWAFGQIHMSARPLRQSNCVSHNRIVSARKESWCDRTSPSCSYGLACQCLSCVIVSHKEHPHSLLCQCFAGLQPLLELQNTDGSRDFEIGRHYSEVTPGSGVARVAGRGSGRQCACKDRVRKQDALREEKGSHAMRQSADPTDEDTNW
jgi:hypothetical protein